MATGSTNGLSNQAFEGKTTHQPPQILPYVKVPSVSATVSMETTSAGIYVNHEQGGTNNRIMGMEEIELNTKNNYQPLCQCEEKGLTCKCVKKSQGIQQRISWESWNKCKTISIAFLVVLVCVWFIVYVTLSHVKAL